MEVCNECGTGRFNTTQLVTESVIVNSDGEIEEYLEAIDWDLDMDNLTCIHCGSVNNLVDEDEYIERTAEEEAEEEEESDLPTPVRVGIPRPSFDKDELF